MGRSDELFLRRLPIGGIGGSDTIFTADFSPTANPMDPSKFLHGATDGIDWHDLQTSGGEVYATAIDTDGVTDNVAQLRRSVLACTDNQFAEATVLKAGGYGSGVVTHELEVFALMKIGAHSIVGLESYNNIGGNHTLVRWNGAHNDFTPLASNNAGNGNMPAYAHGDWLRIEYLNGVINCYHKPAGGSYTLYTTFSDSSLAGNGGNPGMGCNPANDAGGSPVLASAGFSFYRCGNL